MSNVNFLIEISSMAGILIIVNAFSNVASLRDSYSLKTFLISFEPNLNSRKCDQPFKPYAK